MSLESIIGAIGLLAVVILVHELGHFLVAKRCGVDVQVFSLGFGPKLLAWRRAETEYRISAIPLGGYVRMAGQDDLSGPAGGEDAAESDAAVGQDDPQEGDPTRRFSAKTLGQRAAIVAAGPGVNFIFAFLLFAAVAFAYGVHVPVEQARVGGVAAGGPAAKAGLVGGELIGAVDGETVSGWEDLAARVRASEGKTLELTLEAGDGLARRRIEVSPEMRPQRDHLGEEIGKVWMIGIQRATEKRPVGAFESLALGMRYTWFWTRTIFETIGRLFQGRLSVADLGGPIMIAQEAGRRAETGLEPLLQFMALISVNLAIINILPIPVLDGGHLLFFLFEGLRGRPMSLRYRELAQQFGLLLLAALMVFVVFNDLSRIIGG